MQLEVEFFADDLGLILQGLLASWVDSTCSGVSHCTLHRSILQVALKCSDLDITDHLRQFLTLGAKASSWSGKHVQPSAKCIDQSQVGEGEEHNRLREEVKSLSLSISTKLLDIAAKCIAVPGLEVAGRVKGQGVAQEKCVLNKADGVFPTLETMAMEVEPAPVPRRCMHCRSEKTKRRFWGPDGPGTLCRACWYRFTKGRPPQHNHRRHQYCTSNKHRPCMHCGSENTKRWLWGPGGQKFLRGRLIPVDSNPLRRRCMHCGSENTRRWLKGPDGPATLCDSCGQKFYKGRLLHYNSCRGSSSKEDSVPCGVGASLDAFFDHTVSPSPATV